MSPLQTREERAKELMDIRAQQKRLQEEEKEKQRALEEQRRQAEKAQYEAELRQANARNRKKKVKPEVQFGTWSSLLFREV